MKPHLNSLDPDLYLDLHLINISLNMPDDFQRGLWIILWAINENVEKISGNVKEMRNGSLHISFQNHPPSYIKHNVLHRRKYILLKD